MPTWLIVVQASSALLAFATAAINLAAAVGRCRRSSALSSARAGADDARHTFRAVSGQSGAGECSPINLRA